MRRPRRRQIFRHHRHNPISITIWLAGWAAALTLLLGILMVWTDANTGNAIVEGTLRAARWLGTPFRGFFDEPDSERRTYMTWALGAGVYYVLGRLLGWVTRL